MMRFPRGSPLLLALLTLPSCGTDDPNPVDPSPTTVAVEVGNDFFRGAVNGAEPAVDTVLVNGAATWTWVELGAHVVAFDDPDFPLSDALSEIGSQHTQTFPAAGTFPYSCAIHGPTMLGSVVVR